MIHDDTGANPASLDEFPQPFPRSGRKSGKKVIDENEAIYKVGHSELFVLLSSQPFHPFGSGARCPFRIVLGT